LEQRVKDLEEESTSDVSYDRDVASKDGEDNKLEFEEEPIGDVIEKAMIREERENRILDVKGSKLYQYILP
jgi:hypothetical protein